jgi:hypothetical protein
MISPCTSTIYLYYDNLSAIPVSNARSTFIVYDDFATGSSEQWTMTNVTSDRTTNHRLNINGVSGSTSAYLDKGIDIGNYEFLYKYMRTSGGGTGFGAGVGDTITNNFAAQNNGFAGDDHPNKANTNIMKYLYVNPIGNVKGIAAGSTNTTYYAKQTKLNNVFNYIGYSDSARTSQIWGLTYTKSGAELINQRYVYGVMSAADWGYVTTGWLTDIRIRKYTSPDPTFSTIGTEEIFATPANITATSLTINPYPIPCISGSCTVTVDVIWTNTGGTSGSFTPSIKIDNISVVIEPPLSLVTVGPSLTASQQFVISGMTTGTHNICPYPN